MGDLRRQAAEPESAIAWPPQPEGSCPSSVASGGARPPDPRGTGSAARHNALLPADWLAAGYNALLAVVWATLLTRRGYAPMVFAAHAAAVAMPWLLARAAPRLSPMGRALRDVYPLLWLIAFWTELDFLRGLLHESANDGPIAALDLMIFGTHIDAVWIARMPAVWFSELMHLLYFAYYPAIVLPLLFVALRGRAPALRDMAFRVTLTYLACFLVYIVFPVDGPHFLTPQYQGPLNDAFFYRLVRSVQHTGDSLGCSFPSSHVAAVVTMAYLAWRWFPRGVAALLAAGALGVIFSSVYTQNHYAIDVVAGVVWALALQLWVAPKLLRWLERKQRVRTGESEASPGIHPS